MPVIIRPAPKNSTCSTKSEISASLTSGMDAKKSSTATNLNKIRKSATSFRF